MTNRYVVVSGNPIDGLSIMGPFASRDTAIGWAEDIDADWWVTELTTPFPDDTESELDNLCPDGSLERDNDGQFVIYTGEYDADYDSDSQ
jgi:hypothetical protein